MKNKNLKSGLIKIKRLQNQTKVFETNVFEPLELTELKKIGFLKEIMNGWVHLSSPGEQELESTSWSMYYWEFLHKYLKKRFKTKYCLNPEASLLLHNNERYIPKQISVITKDGSSGNVNLPFNASMVIYRDSINLPAQKNITKIKNINVMTVEYALCKAGPTYWRDNPKEVEILMTSKLDFKKTIEILTNSKSKMTTAASRIHGALVFFNRERDANILKSLYDLTFGGSLSSINPFRKEAIRFLSSNKQKSVTSLKLEVKWNEWRDVVAQIGEKIPRVKYSKEQVEFMLENVKNEDIYNSLSIEGYKITHELIKKMTIDNWDFIRKEEKTKDVLAAKGYYDAFNEIKVDLKVAVSLSKYSEEMVEKLHSNWFLTMFMPSMQSGILKASDLLGYRKDQVFIRNSKHVPLEEWELIDAMETYFELLSNEDDPFVQAVLGHYLFAYIHPYMDGNGRMARFIMNTYLILGGINWTVIKVERRNEYMQALENASVEGNIIPFSEFILDSIEGKSST